MYIESLELNNFRNYSSLAISFDRGTNIFYGDNAQGKTNILEALYLCGTTKSHRGSKDREVIRFQEEESHIRMLLKKKGIGHRIDMHLKRNRAKGVAIDGIPIRKASDLLGTVNLIFFSPEDLHMVKNGPLERRKFMDSELCQLSKYYLTRLVNYNRVLAQRNKLLKDISYSDSLRDTLDVWDQQMIAYGSGLIEERESFLNRMNGILGQIHRNLTGGREEIQLVYEPSVRKEDFARQLSLNRERDLKLRLSSTGPHRDDFCIQVNGIDIRRFGSQGQQRSAALSLKLSEIDLVREVVGDQPILLLDDVMSELDSKRQTYLLQNISQIQTFITCTGMDDFIHNQFQINKVFEIVDGTVHNQSCKV